MATQIPHRHVIQVSAKFTMPSGKNLHEIAAAAEKLNQGLKALAEAIGIPVDEIEHTALPVRKKGELAPPAPEPEAQNQPEAKDDAPPAEDGSKAKTK